MPKIITALAIASLVALPLVSCSSPADASCVATPPGSHSSSIKVSGEFGKQPTVTMPPAFNTKETERSVVISGSGDPAVEGDLITANYSAYNASTGAAIDVSKETTWVETTIPIVEGKTLPGLHKALLCARAGDRIVAAMPPDDLFGASGLKGSGIGPTDTVVFIFDVSKVAPVPTDAASPTPEPSTEPAPLPTPGAWADNIPTVDFSGAIPVVTLPKTAPSVELELKVLTEGTGAVVATSSTVTVDYQGTSWDKNAIFDQSYESGKPVSFPVSAVIQGFAAAMVGQKSGATVLVTIPPKYAYGVGEINDKNLVGQTLVFLIQIRDVK